MEEPMESCINYQAQQKRRVVDQKSAVEQWKWIIECQTFVDLWTLYRDKLTAMSIEQTGFISGSNFFLVDLSTFNSNGYEENINPNIVLFQQVDIRKLVRSEYKKEVHIVILMMVFTRYC
ncbi:hypothetical protein BDA99DRAFT_539954 [Phascolomyces articulosus]|uniref:Uncharacterized protein n=1 Tax=Phascolomyces articulosus TaxID=60185 RepID=A0AAD5JVK9_9FUNG|nr:hypothetical protein BDA99DRAFT_539954 [Phascolomyces articulosus]